MAGVSGAGNETSSGQNSTCRTEVLNQDKHVLACDSAMFGASCLVQQDHFSNPFNEYHHI